jgi:hypothetical protein
MIGFGKIFTYVYIAQHRPLETLVFHVNARYLTRCIVVYFTILALK